MKIRQHFSPYIYSLLGVLVVSVSLQPLAVADSLDDILSIKSKLSSRTPPLKAKSIKPSAIAGLYEVYIIEEGILYTDKEFSHVIVNGSMLNTSNKRNLTEESLKQLTTINFNDLPL